MPYLELADGRTIVAGNGADEIEPGADDHSLRAVWKRWALLQSDTNQTEAQKLVLDGGTLVSPGLVSEVNWKIQDHALVRVEKITATQPVALRRFSVDFPSTGDRVSTRTEEGRRIDRFDSPDGSVEVSVTESSVPLSVAIQATGNSALGKGTRGPIPLVLQLQAPDLRLQPGDSIQWTIRLREL